MSHLALEGEEGEKEQDTIDDFSVGEKKVLSGGLKF